MLIKTRSELERLTDAELFAVAVNAGFGNKQLTRSEPAPALTTSACYGCGYSDTVFWTIPYQKQESGLPLFSADAREKITMILAGEHWTTWKALKAAEQSLNAAREAHKDFLLAQAKSNVPQASITAAA